MSNVLFVTDQWGYGGVTTAMAIAAELQGVETRWFASDGPGFRLAESGGFDRVLETDVIAETPSLDFREAIQDSDVLVSIMNAGAARLANSLKTPCIYVDSLLWMWDKPPAPASVTHCFVEDFPGVKARRRRWSQKLPVNDIVGPLITHLTPPNLGARSNVLVNFGGLSSRVIPHKTLVTYAAAMVECISMALLDWPGQITVAAGAHVLRELGDLPSTIVPRDIELAELKHDTYLEKLEESAMLISSAGLHATYEAFARGVPCLLLPAQNLSQALSLRTFKLYGAGCPLDWADIYSPIPLTAANEQQACAWIGRYIHEFKADPAAKHRLVEHLRRQLPQSRLDRVAVAQGAFFRDLASSGTLSIGTYLRRWLASSEERYVSGLHRSGTSSQLAVASSGTSTLR